MRKLPIVCPQTYDGSEMTVTPCTKCSNWELRERRCGVFMGCEHLPVVAAAEVPACVLEATCQHQLQSLPSPCPVRARGMVCESALALAGDQDPWSNPIGFSAMSVSGVGDLEA